jgi:predicted transposase YdaD
MVLTILEDETAMQAARQLVDRAKTEPEHRAIMDMISSILIYKFTNLSRDEVAAMLASNIQESRAYWEIKTEGKQETVLRQLGRKFQLELPKELVQRVLVLPIEQLDYLAEALLDFESMADLVNWLDTHQSSD